MRAEHMGNNGWRVISRGVVAANKLTDSKVIEVFCPEITGMADGVLESSVERLSTDGIDAKNNNYNVTIELAKTITCSWKNDESNRITAPDVRRGANVEVWQYKDSDKYYWSAVGDNNIRKLETVTFAYSATKDESEEELTPDNSYVQQISTHKKSVTLLQTSKANEEKHTHLLQINPGDSVFLYTDDIKNMIQVESQENRIIIRNASGAILELNKEDINAIAPNNINLKCTKFNLDASSSVNIKTPSTNISNNVAIGGNTNIKGSTGVSGSLTVSKYTKLNAGLGVQGGGSFNGSLINNGTNVGDGHRHSGYRGSTTSTPY